MVIGVSVIICCLVYSIMFLLLYFSKGRLDNTENKIYGVLLIVNVIDLIMELLCCYFTYHNGTSTFNSFMCMVCNRMFIILLLTWIATFTFYIFYITISTNPKVKKDLNNYKQKFLKIGSTIYAILFFLALVLPLHAYSDGTYVYSYGAATSLLVIFASVSVVLGIYCVITNRKNIKTRQYYPLFALIFLLTIAIIIRNINPGIILINSTFAFITALMFHTIENPDMQLISELYKNKKLIEKSNEDTSKFLFRITQDLKIPVREILETTSEMKKMKTKDELIEASKYINSEGTQIDYLINKALNIGNMDTQKIKVFENRYNVHNLFKEISYKALEEIKAPVKFNYSIGGSIPNYLYGDAIKIKQAVSSLLKISQSYTKEGFINLDVSSLTRYNLCRLIITVEDSGKGISIDRVNEILSMTTENINEESKQENSNLNIFEIKKLINIIGGSLMIKSEENKGTTVTITLDQKIYETKENEINRRLENYEQNLYGHKKILLIDDDEKEIYQITKILEKDEIDVTASMYGRDAIERIRSKAKYDLIILNDELSDINAINILQELKKIKNFKTPVIVMINDNKEGIKLQYLKDGFTDTISKSKLEIEIDRIIKGV